jgi:hypothetical protein
MGYLKRKQTGDFRGFIQTLKDVQAVYPCGTGDMWVESTGNQKGMTQIAWPEDLRVVAVEFTSQKPGLINQTKQLLGHKVFEWPAIPRLIMEMGNYTLPDTDIVQDIVCMVLCASGAIWKYHPVKAEYRGPQPDRPRAEAVFDRSARPALRGARGRTR